MAQWLRMKPLPTIPNLPSSMAQGSRRKPLLPNVDLSVGGASAPNFRPSMARWLRMKPLPPIPGFPSSMAQRVAAEAAPTKCRSFCRRGFRPELSAFDGPVAADEAASLNPGLSVFDGAKGRGESRSYKGGSRFVYSCSHSWTAPHRCRNEFRLTEGLQPRTFGPRWPSGGG